MTEVSLAKALRMKNKLAGEIGELGRRIHGYNVTRQENKPAFSVDACWEEREKKVAILLNLKAAISAANVPIQKEIFRLAELKAAAAMVRDINTQEGVVQDRYQETPAYTNVAQWDALKVAAVLDEISIHIEKAQDKLDAHNATTKIEL